MAAGGTAGRRPLLSELETVRIERIAAGGDGVGHLKDGRVVFVPRTAVGDEVAVSIQVAKKRWARGWAASVRSPGPARVTPPCPLFSECGGCTLQHIAYPAQLAAKRTMVEDALQRIGGVFVVVPEVRPASLELRYRARARFHLRRLPGPRVVAGFHRWDRPGRIVDVEACPVLAGPLDRAWKALRAHWGSGARHLPSGQGLELTLREVDDGVVLAIAGGEGPGNAEALLRGVPTLLAVWSQPRGNPPRLLAGDRTVETSFAGGRYRLGAGAFLQVHRSVGAALVEAVVEAVGPPTGSARAVDAYGGVGVYGSALRRLGWAVTVIDSNPIACREARRAGLEVVEAPVEVGVARALPAEVVVLNPPRAGIEEGVAALLVNRGPPRMVYVSCDPATLARDLARLTRYRIAGLDAFDMFPQTAHVESLVTLERTDGGAT